MSFWRDSIYSQGKPISQSTPIKMGFALYSGEVLDENTQRALPRDHFKSKDVHLVIWVHKTNGNVSRLPGQHLKTVPYAITAYQADDFEVKGDLTVVGKTHLGDDLDVDGESRQIQPTLFILVRLLGIESSIERVICKMNRRLFNLLPTVYHPTLSPTHLPPN